MTEVSHLSAPAPFNPELARDLTDRIKVAIDGTWQLIQQAYISRAWAALGYRSWDDYCTREFGSSRLRLPREERQEVVASLREIGMSVRAIASATGQDKNTVMKELRQVSEFQTPALEPRPVTGTDGKTYQRPVATPAPQPTPERPAPSRPPLPPQFQSATNELTRVIARIERLREDDRYRGNRASISNQCLPEIRRAASVLHDLLLDLGHESGGPA